MKFQICRDPRIYILVLCPAFLCAVVPATAGNLFDGPGLADPFATEAMTAPAPQFPWRSSEPALRVPEPKSPIPAETSGPLSLAQLTELALLNNPATHKAWAVARAQAAELGIASSLFWPELNGLVNLTHSKSISSSGASVPTQTRYGPSVSLAYVLFDFGVRAGKLEAARYRLLAANLLQNRVLQDVVLLVEETLKSVSVSLKAASVRRQAGLATIGDVYRAETAVGQARLALHRNQGGLSKARGQLAVAVGMPVDTRLELNPWPSEAPITEVLESLDLILRQAKTMRPDLIAAEAEVRAAGATVQAASAAGRPRLELAINGARTLFTDERPESDSYSINLNLRIPLFTGFRDTYNVRFAQAQAEQAEAARDRLHRQSGLEVWQAYYDLNTAATGIDTSSGVLKSAKQSAEVALARYKSGVGSLLDLLTARPIKPPRGCS